ncbi:glycosyltransferase [Streptomyces sp. NPDC057411]|uniref:glycosyltransferase n=1 Tax=Streptomyces sp. NPDC057411 TaxID=3346122 RepID=UPI00369256A5
MTPLSGCWSAPTSSTSAGLTTSRGHACSPTAAGCAARPHHPTGFVGEEFLDVLALADVVISCSGAGALAELTVLRKPACFMPLATSAGNEQAHNAWHLEEAGAAVAWLVTCPRTG